jgi:outer membrane protein TolC
MVEIKKSFPTVLACLWILFVYAPFAPAQETVTLTLDEAVNRALLVNPDLSAMEAMARALADIPEQVGALPDPQLAFRALNLPTDTFSSTQEAMTQMQVGLSQALPFPGKLSLLQEAADFESQAAEFRLEEKRLMLIQDVKTVWWNIFYLDQAIDTVERNQELFRQLNNIAETKYKVGKGLQQDVLLAQLELSKLLDDRITLTNLRKNESIRLNTLLDQHADTQLILPGLESESIPDLPDLDVLLEQARNSNPAIQDLTSRVDAAGARVKLAELKYYPDFMAGAAYGFRGGENPDGSGRADFATFSIGMTLPFFNLTEKRRAVSQRRYEEIQRRKILQNTENSVQGRVTRAISDFKRATDEIELLKEGIIPQARQTLDSMLAGYQVNKVDFLNLVRAQTALYNYETRYWKSLSSANQAIARLSAAVGKEKIHE